MQHPSKGTPNGARGYDGIMLPTPTDNGARLAAILPTAIASMAVSAGYDPMQLLEGAAVLRGSAGEAAALSADRLPAVRSIVLLVVDGLGHANLKAAAGHARTLASLPSRRIETVIPSTTGAALTTLTTGTLPGVHGLLGYRIRHPKLGLVTTLKDWSGVEDRRAWQRAEPLFGLATRIGARAVAIGRPAHANGGLTEAILTGAEYHGGQTIAERFGIASRLARSGDPLLAYLYVDELDRAAHREGWQSDKWLQRLEQLDAALQDLLRSLPGDVGVIVTADHGMVDIVREKRMLLDHLIALDAVALIGGEPRLRSLYLRDPPAAQAVAQDVQRALGKLAWVGTRDEAISQGWFGSIDAETALRLGDVLIAARGQVAFMLTTEDAAVQDMVGHHGSLSDEERGIPLALAGALEGTGFAGAVGALAASRAE